MLYFLCALKTLRDNSLCPVDCDTLVLGELRRYCLSFYSTRDGEMNIFSKQHEGGEP